jgi:omega-amidase
MKLIINQHQEKITISVLQMKPVIGQYKENIEYVHMASKIAASQNTDLLILPELWSTGYDLTSLEISANNYQDIHQEIQAICDEYCISVAGTYVRRENGQFFNTMAMHSANILPSYYDKIHLFGLTGENKVFSQGKNPTIVNFKGWRIGLSICYDLRFPELFRLYRSAKVDMVIISAAWPLTRLSHWQILCQSRAIENQVYIAACNQIGCGVDSFFAGHSMVIDPLGEIITNANDRENGLVSAQCDLAIVAQVREQMPVYNDINAHLVDQLAGKLE